MGISVNLFVFDSPSMLTPCLNSPPLAIPAYQLRCPLELVVIVIKSDNCMIMINSKPLMASIKNNATSYYENNEVIIIIT